MRRKFLLVVAVLTMVVATMPTANARPFGRDRYDQPRNGFAPPSTTLHRAAPESVGLDPRPITKALGQLKDWTQPSGKQKPMFPGAVTALGHDGTVVTQNHTGKALRYADSKGTELPADQQIPMRNNTIFDMASVSKLFTAIAVMQQIQAGRVDLDKPVADYVPEFGENGKQHIVVRQLLTHTSGLPDTLPLWREYPDKQSRFHAALTAKPVTKPGSTFTYSDLNFIALGVLVERVTGKPLQDVVRDRITKPLHMVDTQYNPPKRLRHRIAATEYQEGGKDTTDRGLVWGQVHDENCWSMGGVTGHAGVFSTTHDMSILAQALLNGGTYRGARILAPASVKQMITNYNTKFPDDSHGLGFELNQRWYMGGLAGPRTAGHTGFTGTSIVLDFASRSFAILLTNRVHPSRDWGSNNSARVAVAQALAESMAVKPRHGHDAWFSGTRNDADVALDAPVDVPADGADLSFDLFMDAESTDLLHLETSTDNGKTFKPVPFDVIDRGETTGTDGTYTTSGKRRWEQVHAKLGAGKQLIRWRYKTDATLQGRGVYVDGVKATSDKGVVFDGERHPDAFRSNGWRLASR